MLAIAQPNDATLTRENWQAAVHHAVATLPEDFRERITVEKSKEEEIIIQLQIETISQDAFETMMDLADPGYLFDDPVEPDPHATSTVKHSLLVQFKEDKIEVENAPQFHWVGREDETTDLGKSVHLAILDCLADYYAVAKDNFGRFYRLDGSRVLLWQWGE